MSRSVCLKLLNGIRSQGRTVLLCLLGVGALCACSGESDVAFPETYSSVLIVGDVAFGESYTIASAMLRDVGYDHSLAGLTGLLEAADVFVGNLQSPLTDRRTSRYVRRKSYIHYSDPRLAAQAFVRHGMEVFSLANNHAMNFDGPGLEDTFESGRRHGLEFFGAGRNRQDADRPHLLELTTPGVTSTLAIFGVFEFRARYQEEFSFYATDEFPGVSALDGSTADRVRQFRQDNPDVFVVVYPHWGKNYQWRTEQQAAVARSLIDAGADLVVGHGAHRLQEIERYGDGWILYNLGNFMFNSRGRYQKLGEPPYSAAIMLDVGRDSSGALARRIRLYPLITDNLLTKFQSRGVNEQEITSVQAVMRGRVNNDALESVYQDEQGLYFQLPY